MVITSVDSPARLYSVHTSVGEVRRHFPNIHSRKQRGDLMTRGKVLVVFGRTTRQSKKKWPCGMQKRWIGLQVCNKMHNSGVLYDSLMHYTPSTTLTPSSLLPSLSTLLPALVLNVVDTEHRSWGAELSNIDIIPVRMPSWVNNITWHHICTVFHVFQANTPKRE